MSREDSTIIIEAERERLRQQGSELANLMPVTPMTPGQGQNQNQGGNATTTTGSGGNTGNQLPIPGRRVPPVLGGP
jgi:hypothetical protein